MSKKTSATVFVGNIPYGTTEDQLRDVFSQVGNVVNFRILYDKETGKPKGFGFCEYEDAETAMSAIRNLNGVEVNGRSLRVDYTENEKREMAGLDGGPADVGGGRQQQQQQQQQPGGMQSSNTAPGQQQGRGPQGPSPLLGGGLNLKDMSLQQIFDVMIQLKGLLQQNPDQLRNLLLSNPALAHAIVMGQIMLGLVNANAIVPPSLSMGPPPPHMQPPAPMMNPVQLQQRMMPPGPGAFPGVDQAALVQQVMSMTPQQIDMLPPDQRATVLQMRANIQKQMAPMIPNPQQQFRRF